MKISFLLSAIMTLFIPQLSLHASQSSVLWHNSTTGAVKIMPIDGINPTPGFTVVDSSNVNLVPRGMGDFTGDGQPDILFHNQNSGNLRIWKMDGTSKVDNIQILGSSNANLKIAGIGDFDQDGDNDIATFNTNSGALRIWVMDGTTRIDNVRVLTGANTNLVPNGVGDMNSDGVPDIALRNNNSSAVRIWIMSSDFSRLSNEYIRSGSNTNLELRGVVDINGDGNNDILNYNKSTGVLRAWLMDGDLVITENAEIVQETDLDWSVGGAANENYAIIYINDGAVQCESKGLSKEQTAQKLIDNGIDVVDSQCGYLSNIVVPTLCGLGDANINLHIINAQDLSKAQTLGFESVLTLKRGDDIGYVIEDC